MSNYQLAAELAPQHQSDVKAVIQLPNNRIASASRDQSVVVWKQAGQSYELEAILDGHGAYVNALAYIPADEAGIDYLASSGNSTLILLHSLSSTSPDAVHALVGHALNVCTLAYSSSYRRLISGSWDLTARVWSCDRGDNKGWGSELVLEGHEAAVWGVAVVDAGPRRGCYLTGSADRMINIWSETGEVLSRIKGSPDPVRSLALLPEGAGFVSACNDGLVRKWDWTGSVTQALRGHTDYVYEAVLNFEGTILSCGEDHTARVWRGDGTNEAILHPCQTVWAVAGLDNGDVVTGGSDGRVRIWTKDPARFATDEVREAYSETIKSIVKPTTDVDDTPKTITISIDVSDTDPPIPLVFELGSDPRAAAEAFGATHSMSPNYINQIEEFIKLHIQ